MAALVSPSSLSANAAPFTVQLPPSRPLKATAADLQSQLTAASITLKILLDTLSKDEQARTLKEDSSLVDISGLKAEHKAALEREQNKLADERRNHAQKMAGLTIEKNSLAEQLATEKANATTLFTRITASEAQKWTKKTTDLQKENDDLKAALAEFHRDNEARETRLAEALKETADHASAIGHYQIAVDELNELIGTLKEEQGRLEGMVDEGERQIEFLESSMVGLNEKVEELNATVEGGEKERVEPVPAGAPFSMALIDGNDFIFTPDFLRDGFKGGRRAAQTLQLSLFKVLKERFASEDDRVILDALAKSIIVQVFINRAGLTDKLIKGGIVATSAIFSDWLAGFLSAQELFSVVDVGPTKDATSIRVREHLRVYAAQPSCKTLFLGAPRGVEYATFLSELRDSPRIKDIALLKGCEKIEKEFKPFQDLVVETPNLFLKDKIKWTTPAQASSDLARIDDQDFDLPPLPPLQQSTQSPEQSSSQYLSSSPLSPTSVLPPQALPLNPFASISSETNATVASSSPNLASSQPLGTLSMDTPPSKEPFVKAPVAMEETPKEARERRRKMREKQAEGSQSSSAVGEETGPKPIATPTRRFPRPDSWVSTRPPRAPYLLSPEKKPPTSPNLPPPPPSPQPRPTPSHTPRSYTTSLSSFFQRRLPLLSVIILGCLGSVSYTSYHVLFFTFNWILSLPLLSSSGSRRRQTTRSSTRRWSKHIARYWGASLAVFIALILAFSFALSLPPDLEHPKAAYHDEDFHHHEHHHHLPAHAHPTQTRAPSPNNPSPLNAWNDLAQEREAAEWKTKYWPFMQSIFPESGDDEELAKLVWDWTLDSLEETGLEGGVVFNRDFKVGDLNEAEREMMAEMLEVSWDIKEVVWKSHQSEKRRRRQSEGKVGKVKGGY